MSFGATVGTILLVLLGLSAIGGLIAWGLSKIDLSK